MNPVHVHHGIETALPLRPFPGYVRLEGWAFIAGAPAATSVRLRIGETTFAPESASERPDVAAAFSHEPHAAHSGFRFLCTPRFGLHLGTLEASADGELWHAFRTLPMPVASHPLLGAFEKPAPTTHLTEPARIEGWCFHPDFHVEHVVLLMGKLEIECDYRLNRPDVAGLFPTHADARHAGFITKENLPRGAGRLRLRADTACGRSFFLESTLQADIDRGKYQLGSRLASVSTPVNVAPPKDNRHRASRSHSSRPPPGERNLLFALYGDFTCNSALHVTALANELIDLGYDCVVAGTSHKETISALPRARFMALEFDEWEDLPDYFLDGRGPALVHAWTPRENVRQFTEKVCAAYGIPHLVHLEDHEGVILESRLGRTVDDLLRLPADELDRLVPPYLAHPRRSLEFLKKSAGVTTIVEKLVELVPPGVPTLTFWPAADSAVFSPRPRNPELRAALGIAESDVVLFYHGNVHAANAEEVGSLYEAVALLNRRGRRTLLIRTGRDAPDLITSREAEIKTHLLHLGYLATPRLIAEVMRLADCFVQPGAPGAFNDFRFPSKLPEFFSIGRPVILPRTNLGTAVQHGLDAYVLDHADGESIAAAVEQVQTNQELNARLSEGALAFARARFSWRNAAETLAAFYQAVAPVTPTPRRAT